MPKTVKKAVKKTAKKPRRASQPRRGAAESTGSNFRESERVKLAQTRDDPVAFSTSVLHHTHWLKQKQLMRAVAEHPLVLCKSGHSLSKTFSAADLTLWWITRYSDGVVLTTSPTGRQVESLLWGEIRKTLSADPRPDLDYPQSNLAQIKISEGNLAMGFSTSAETSGVNFAGFKAANLLIIVDEAIGVEGPIWDALEGARAGGNVHVLVLFNPVAPIGQVYEFCTRDRARWKIFTFDCMQSPNLAGEAATETEIEALLDQMRALPTGLKENEHELFAHKPWPMLATRHWVYEMLKKHGERSIFWQARIRARFPEQSEDALYPLTWLERAGTGDFTPDWYIDSNVIDLARIRSIAEVSARFSGDCEVGIDVAGPGRDKTVVRVRKGDRVVGGRSWAEPDPRAEVALFLEPWRNMVKTVAVDSSGIGYYFAKDLSDKGYRVIFVNFGGGMIESGTADLRFANPKSAMYWEFRKLLESNSIHNLDEETIAQATQQRYTIDTRTQAVTVMPKEKLKKLGTSTASSPDEFEATMLAFCGAKIAAGATTKLELVQGSAASNARTRGGGDEPAFRVTSGSRFGRGRGAW